MLVFLWPLGIFYGHLENLMAIWHSLGTLVCFSSFGMFGPRKIWQPCLRGDEAVAFAADGVDAKPRFWLHVEDVNSSSSVGICKAFATAKRPVYIALSKFLAYVLVKSVAFSPHLHSMAVVRSIINILKLRTYVSAVLHQLDVYCFIHSNRRL
jgi:hypothetical protein